MIVNAGLSSLPPSMSLFGSWGTQEVWVTASFWSELSLTWLKRESIPLEMFSCPGILSTDLTLLFNKWLTVGYTCSAPLFISSAHFLIARWSLSLTTPHAPTVSVSSRSELFIICKATLRGAMMPLVSDFNKLRKTTFKYKFWYRTTFRFYQSKLSFTYVICVILKF